MLMSMADGPPNGLAPTKLVASGKPPPLNSSVLIRLITIEQNFDVDGHGRTCVGSAERAPPNRVVRHRNGRLLAREARFQATGGGRVLDRWIAPARQAIPLVVGAGRRSRSLATAVHRNSGALQQTACSYRCLRQA
jgi:hypothetical protein